VLKENLVLYIDANSRPNALSFDPNYLRNGAKECTMQSSSLYISTDLSIGKGLASTKSYKIDPPAEIPSTQSQPEGIVGLVQRYVSN
jgi:hypothetical protein